MMGNDRLIAGVMMILLIGTNLPSATPDDDPIAQIIRQAQERREPSRQTASAWIPRDSAETKSRSASSSNEKTMLTNQYERLATFLAQAMAVKRPDLLQLPRERLETMLRAMLAQAAYETGRFRSKLSVEACNYWGMKDRPDIKARTIAYKNGTWEKFDSVADGCAGYIQALSRGRYRGFEEHTGNVREMLDWLAAAGWCPESTYGRDAERVFEKDRRWIDHATAIALTSLDQNSKSRSPAVPAPRAMAQTPRSKSLFTAPSLPPDIIFVDR